MPKPIAKFRQDLSPICVPTASMIDESWYRSRLKMIFKQKTMAAGKPSLPAGEQQRPTANRCRKHCAKGKWRSYTKSSARLQRNSTVFTTSGRCCVDSTRNTLTLVWWDCDCRNRSDLSVTWFYWFNFREIQVVYVRFCGFCAVRDDKRLVKGLAREKVDVM